MANKLLPTFLPGRWRRQPTQPVGIDFGNPLANGLLDVFSPPLTRGAVTKCALDAVSGGPTISGGDQGLAWTTSGGSGTGLSVSKTYSAGTFNITFFALFTPTDAPSGATYGSLFYEDYCAFQYDHANAAFQTAFVINNSLGWYPASFAVPTAGKTVLWVGTFDAAAHTVSAYTNGSLTSATDCGVTTAITSSAALLSIGYRPSYPWNGKIYLAGISGRTWSTAEVTEFARNPWQLFAPARRVFYSLPPSTPTGKWLWV